MYPLLAVSLFGFAIFIERTLFLHKGRIGTEDFLGGIKNLVRKRRLVEALALCDDTASPLGRIVKSALLNYGESAMVIRSAIQGAAIIEIPELERRIGTLATLARIAPLLGFLGTIISALKALYWLETANADSGAFSRSLAEALITSASGLAIGVMALLAHHFLTGRVRALVHDFEWVGHEIYGFLTTDPELQGSQAAEGSAEE